MDYERERATRYSSVTGMEWTGSREPHPRPRNRSEAEAPPSAKRRRRGEDRVLAACDLCKERKVKCDGQQPCAYCAKRSRGDSCTFSGPKHQVRPPTLGNYPAGAAAPSPHHPEARRSTAATPTHRVASPPAEDHDDRQDTAVPLDARLLRDARGSTTFIGDCAPISFLQTVRQLIATNVSAVPRQLIKDSVIEASSTRRLERHNEDLQAAFTEARLAHRLQSYRTATSGIVDLFDWSVSESAMRAWVQRSGRADDPQHDSASPSSALFLLVFAIGTQDEEDTIADICFTKARQILLSSLSEDVSVDSVRGFALMSVYMLRAFQPNAAYLNFGFAARCGYAIGLHRGEVNAIFRPDLHLLRSRTWKSLRVLDMLMSTLLGRPTSTADVDCTVEYERIELPPRDYLSASVQIFLIIERIVLEVYSRKRISLRIANYISQQLKAWAGKWLQALVQVARGGNGSNATSEDVVGACQTICSYHYGIMLLTRPFLIYKLYEYLGTAHPFHGTHAEHREKMRYADAAIVAATGLVDTLEPVIRSETMPRRMPMVVSWLFTASMVLAVGVLGPNGLSFDSHCRSSIACLAYFAEIDPLARQFQEIAQTLLDTTRAHVDKHQEFLRTESKRATAQLFGMLTDMSERASAAEAGGQERTSATNTFTTTANNDPSAHGSSPTDLATVDPDLFALPWLNEVDPDLREFLQPNEQSAEGQVAAIPLFPVSIEF